MQLKKFINPEQLGVITRNARESQETEFFRDKLAELVSLASNIPGIYETDGQGKNATAHLHYFTSSADWYITECDATMPGGVEAFGYADLGGGGELGYIDIAAILQAGAELDLYFKPQPLINVIS